ncbi:PEGA domain-containing protein [Methanofollis fontis]|uniref:PEGA domain-containing protein n=1 Tax=Methanofollis fontis TaxID=2052832 RepID=A0A483CV12_9EURY|nr:PEGA domain-containing protein [Methanofollis fontis]TAJ45307.1 hypothetical protein CUJ86_00740 [Methanofollis fontis]
MNTRKILVVGFILTALLVSAASAADLMVTPQNSTSALGDITDLTLRVENVEHLGGFDIDLRWDPSVVTLVTEPGGVTIGPLFSGDVNDTAYNAQSGRIRVAAVNATLDGVSGSADLFTVRLRTADDTGKSTDVVAVVNNYGFLNSTSGDDIPVDSITNATITTQRVNRIVSRVGVPSERVPEGAETLGIFTVVNQRGIPTSALTINTTIYAPDGSVFNTTERSGVTLAAYGQDVQRTAWTPTAGGIYTLNVTVTSDTGLPVVGTPAAERSVTAREYTLEFYPYVYGPSRAQAEQWFGVAWYVKPSESGRVHYNLSVPAGMEVYSDAEGDRWMGGGYWNYIGFSMRTSRPGTIAADSINLTVSANGKTVSKTSPRDVFIWIPSIPVSSVDSVNANSDSTFGMTFNTLHTNNTYDNVTTITVQSGARGRTLTGLGYLVRYPYGCVEQTTSQMLASLNVKNYYLDRPDKPTNYATIRDDANASVQGGINVLVNGGTRGQHSDGGWSLWGYGASESSSSSYAAYTLARVNESTEDLNRLLTGKISTGDTVSSGTVNFEKLVEWFHENPDNPSSGTWTWSAGVCHAWTPTSNTGFVMLIHDMIRTQGTVSEPYATYMTENMQNATRYFIENQAEDGHWGGNDDKAMATALGLWGLESYGTTSVDVTQTQIDNAKANATAWLIANQDSGDGHWDADSYYGWYSNGRRTESTAYAVLALNATGITADNGTIQRGVGWLINQYDSGGSWGYTWATQAAIDALIHCQPIVVSSGTIDVSIDGTPICTITVDSDTPKETYTLTADQMAAMMAVGSLKRTIDDYSTVKEHQVEVTRSGGGTGAILVSVENDQRAPINEIDDTIEDSGTIQMLGDGFPDTGATGVLSVSENMDLLGDALPQAMLDSVSLTSSPSPLVANESGELTLRVVSGENVLSPLIEVPIEGFTFANGTITENGETVSYERLSSSVNDDATSIYIEPDHWESGSTYDYVFDVTPEQVGTLDFQLRFRPLYDEMNVTLSEKSLSVTGRGAVEVSVTDEDSNPVEATIILDGESQTASSHTFTGLLAGTYPLSVSKEGYITVNDTVAVTANSNTSVTVMMPTDLTTPRLILSQGSGSLGGVSEVPAVLSAGFAENATYNATLVGNGGMLGLALEFPERFMLNDPVVTLNGEILNSSEYEVRNGSFSNLDPYQEFVTTNATIVIYNAPDGVSEVSIRITGGLAGQSLVGEDIVGIWDALRVAQFDAYIKGAPETYGYCDVTGDQMVNIADALRIAQYDAGLIPDLN